MAPLRQGCSVYAKGTCRLWTAAQAGRAMVGSGVGVIAVTGATGLQGGAVTRALLQGGWHVRALTRDPRSKKARSLAALGADVMRADMDDARSLEPAFDGVAGVFTVQNHHISGYEGEVRQAKNVTDVAKRLAVPHVVYGAAGIGTTGTGIGSWETKVDIGAYMRAQGLPVTILRPMAFMELMTESKFFPAASTWHVMPTIMGSTRPVGWVAVDDLAAVAVTAFTDPERFVGRDLPLVADVQSIDECRRVWRAVMGRAPRRFPMPVWLFERFVGSDETTMWRWLRVNEIDLDIQPMRDVHPAALTVREWLHLQKASAGPDPARREGAT